MNSVGVMILEELAERRQSLSALRGAIGASDDGIMCEYLDGRRSILPIARNLARFFGTSVSLWKNIAYQSEKRSENRQETVSQEEGPVGCIVRLNADLGDLQARFCAILGPEMEDRRASQDAKYGGPHHDDTHKGADWCSFIAKFTARARQYGEAEIDIDKYEDALIDIGALAISAIRSSRRKHGIL